MGPEAEHAGSPVVVVGSRVVPRSAYRPSPLGEIADTPAWWSAITVLGGLLVGVGILLALGSGTATAVGGVLLFLATAVVAGFERVELATSLALSAITWTAAGTSVVMGVDPAVGPTSVAFLAVGVVLLGLGVWGRARHRSR
jgi:hypothetical protein